MYESKTFEINCAGVLEPDLRALTHALIHMQLVEAGQAIGPE